MEKYYEVIDGKQVPTWALQPVDYLNDHDIKARAKWVLICDMSKKVFQNPDEWKEILEEFDKMYKNDYDYFVYWNSEDFFYMKSKSKRSLDDKITDVPSLSNFTLRQIIKALSEIAYNAINTKTIDEIKEIAKGALECSMLE